MLFHSTILKFLDWSYLTRTGAPGDQVLLQRYALDNGGREMQHFLAAEG